MDIQIRNAKLNVGANATLSVAEASEYVSDEIRKAVEIFDIEPASAVVVLKTEGSADDPVQKVEIKLILGDNIINQSAHSRSIKKAIDRAIPELKRQVKRAKTKKIEKGRSKTRQAKKKADTDKDAIFAAYEAI